MDPTTKISVTKAWVADRLRCSFTHPRAESLRPTLEEGRGIYTSYTPSSGNLGASVSGLYMGARLPESCKWGSGQGSVQQWGATRGAPSVNRARVSSLASTRLRFGNQAQVEEVGDIRSSTASTASTAYQLSLWHLSRVYQISSCKRLFCVRSCFTELTPPQCNSSEKQRILYRRTQTGPYRDWCFSDAWRHARPIVFNASSLSANHSIGVHTRRFSAQLNGPPERRPHTLGEIYIARSTS
jgi:hypothetical protein